MISGAQRPLQRVSSHETTYVVERLQTGVRMQKNLLKVLKALAEYLDLTLGDLLEGIVLHSFEGKPPFSPEVLDRIVQLKEIYGLTLDASASHKLVEVAPKRARASRPVKPAVPEASVHRS